MTVVTKQVPAAFQASDKHMRALKDLQTEQQALNEFVERVVQQGQLKLQKLQRRGGDIWAEIAREHGIDIQNVAWAPDFDLGKIVPIQVSLVPRQPARGFDKVT